MFDRGLLKNLLLGTLRSTADSPIAELTITTIVSATMDTQSMPPSCPLAIVDRDEIDSPGPSETWDAPSVNAASDLLPY
jgi:hypothetical protein